MSDLFDTKNIQPMLIGESAAPFDREGWIYELKWDGERCLAYLDPKAGTELRNKRNVRMLPRTPELGKLHKQVKRRCILDGELMCLVDGKPNFAAIQRRSLMSNTFKIELDAKKHPATFVAFDMLYLDEQELFFTPLVERKKLLQNTVKENERLAISRQYEQGVALYKLAEEQQLEGIVAKRADSLYYQGKRTKDWIKIKNMQDEDFVICGYINKSNHMTSIVLGLYSDGLLHYEGHVTLGVGGAPFRQITDLDKVTCPILDVPAGHGNEDAIWVSPTLVCTVSYMHRTAGGGMRQPVFKGLRPDKTPAECQRASTNHIS